MNLFEDIADQRILVTGASSGIGRATSILLSKLGAKLILAGRSEERLKVTSEMLDGNGHLVYKKDLSEAGTITVWLKEIAQDVGTLNGLVHSAGIHAPNPVRFLKDEEFTNILNVNVNTSVQLARGFRQKQVRGEAASIVFLSSVLGIVGQAGVAAYAASKGAICAITKSTALEFAPEGIRVNCIAPGIVRTEMTSEFQTKLTDSQFDALCSQYPLGIGEPEDVANAIVFLLSSASKWITGTTLLVDGGFTAQ